MHSPQPPTLCFPSGCTASLLSSHISLASATRELTPATVHNMNIASDFLRLTDTIGLVPGLTAACRLAIQILQTVQVCDHEEFGAYTDLCWIIQISKRNTARLQYLAHLVAESLATIAEHMKGKWDDTPAPMKIKLDEYEASVLPIYFMIHLSYLNRRILQDLLKIVRRRSSSSTAISLFNAGDRDFEITMLERRLTDTQRSILAS